MKVWMEVTKDDLELPVAVAETIEELARITGKSVNNIKSQISKAKKQGSRARYIRVEVNMSIKAIVKKPSDKYGYMCNLLNDLKTMQDIVGGWIEAISPADGIVIICNEEGKLLGLPKNMKIPHDELVGTIIVCGTDDDEFTDCPIDMDEWKRMVDEWNI